MAFSPTYERQLELLIRCLPALSTTPDFALKGGTAINLFHQNFPRLSVDIDLTYLPITARAESIANIRSGLITLQEYCVDKVRGVEVEWLGSDDVPKLLIRHNNVSIKIEPSPVLRGTLVAPEIRKLVSRAEARFKVTADTLCVAIEDLYAGKFCAALDRQHPRDLFDIRQYLKTHTLDDIRGAFVSYLCCHNRPISDLLDPRPLEIGHLFKSHFAGMTDPAMSLEALLATRQFLFDWALNALTDDERQFLVSVKKGQPDYSLAPYPVIETMPAFQWKLRNIKRMSPRKHKASLNRLQQLLKV